MTGLLKNIKEEHLSVIGALTVTVLVLMGFGIASWLVSGLYINWLEFAWWVSTKTHIPFVVTIPATALLLTVPGAIYVGAQEIWRKLRRK